MGWKGISRRPSRRGYSFVSTYYGCCRRFDALSSARVYKPAFPIEKALAILEEGSGTQFDPKCVEVFMEALPEVKIILRKYNQTV